MYANSNVNYLCHLGCQEKHLSLAFKLTPFAVQDVNMKYVTSWIEVQHADEYSIFYQHIKYIWHLSLVIFVHKFDIIHGSIVVKCKNMNSIYYAVSVFSLDDPEILILLAVE